MANFKPGPIISDIRGSIGGTCFGRGGGGAVVRNSPKPCNPRSVLQSARRATLAYLSSAWSSLLTEVERTAWRTYAAGTAWTNKVGTAASISGLAAFVRLNTLLIMCGETVETTAPAIAGHPGTPILTITAVPTDQHVHLTAVSEPFLPLDADHRMILMAHSPTSKGRLCLSGIKRYLNTFVGVPVSGPGFPIEYVWPFPFVAGQHVSMTGILIDSYGRVGGDYVATVVAAVP